MSAPQTNLEKQRKRHWGPLLGMALVVIFGVLIIFYWLAEESAQSDPPSQTPAAGSAPAAPEAAPTQVIPPAGGVNAPPSPAAPPVAPAN